MKVEIVARTDVNGAAKEKIELFCACDLDRMRNGDFLARCTSYRCIAILFKTKQQNDENRDWELRIKDRGLRSMTMAHPCRSF